MFFGIGHFKIVDIFFGSVLITLGETRNVVSNLKNFDFSTETFIFAFSNILIMTI